METIIKKLYREPLITRFPVCYPSLVDGEITYYSPYDDNALQNAFYGEIPLGVSEDICGSYANFTTEMGEKYGGKVLHCYTLQKWMIDFRRYFDILRSSDCYGEFNDIIDYYERTYPKGYDEALAEEIEKTFLERGGRNFYQWLLDNYFVTLDFLAEYDNIVSGNSMSAICDYDVWRECVRNIGTQYMTFPDALRFFAKMEAWDSLYYWEDCSEFETCCDCVDYLSYGGHDTYLLLDEWIKRITENIENINDIISEMENTIDSTEVKKLIPSTDLNISIKRNVEDLGTYIPFCLEFVPGARYVNGQVCSYDGDVYILTGFSYTNIEFHPELGWVKYYEYIKDGTDFNYHKELSGRTVSNLESLIRKDVTIDVMGNALPGHFEPNTDSKFMQPAENTLIEFMYKPGTYNNIERYKDDNGIQQLFLCDYLDKIEFYYKDLNGDIVPETVTEALQGDDVNEKIEQCINIYNANEDEMWDNVLNAKFYSYRNVPVSFDENGIITRRNDLGAYLKCVDHCEIEIAPFMYQLSDSVSYPIRYYEVNMDVEEMFSEEKQEYIHVCLCDFFFDISEFDRNYVAMPLLRVDELLPFSSVQNPTGNIYINRGYATSNDRHLRMGEINTVEQLEKYGNGIFQMYKVNE